MWNPHLAGLSRLEADSTAQFRVFRPSTSEVELEGITPRFDCPEVAFSTGGRERGIGLVVAGRYEPSGAF